MSNVAATGVPVSAGVERGQSSRPPGHGVPVHVAILTHTSRDDHRGGVGVRDGAGRPKVFIQTLALVGNTVLLNSDPEKKKLLHPKSIPTSQCYYCTLIFNNFEMFRMKTFEIRPQTGGVNA